MKLKHYESVAVEVTTSRDYHKVVLKDWRGEYANKNSTIGTFYVPLSSVDKFQQVPEAIIAARAKHDFRVTFDHYTYMGMIVRQ